MVNGSSGETPAKSAGPVSRAFPNAKQRRKVKQEFAVQSAVNHVGSSSSTTATCTSLSNTRMLNVEEFANARAFEINAMESAILNSTQFIGNKRVFQRIPRHMRRRPASHNPKRLPRIIRQRAIAQMALDPPLKPPRKKKYPRKAKRQSALQIFQEFGRRQATKKWLETHVFHAKRFHMETLFGFALPVSSNDKSARSMYRSVTSHSIIHDASYTRMIQLETAGGGGNEGLNAIIELMQGVTDPSLPGVGSKQFIFGNRFGGTVLYSTSKNWPAGAIAPIDFLWKRGGGGRRGGGRGGGGDGASADSSTHTLWIFVHPSAFNQALKALQETNASLSSSSCQVSITPLDPVEMNHFQIFGPRSHAILDAVLKLCKDDNGDGHDHHREQHESWSRLVKNSVYPSSTPPGTVYDLYVQDPRVNFPPVAETRHEIHERLPNTLIDTATASYSSPSSQILTSCDLWIKEIREAVSLHGPLNESWFKKEGNEEKEAPIALDNTPATASTTTPNTATASTQKRGLPNPSVRIPILVLQRALTSTRSLQHSKSGGYSILLPRSWGSTFIHSFVYAGCRVAGMDELQALEFEDLMGRGGSSSSSGPLLNLPSFPFHWLGTTAGNTWLNTKDEGRLLEMNKKPPAKRGVALKTEWSMEKSTVRLLSDLSKQVTGGLDVMDVDGDSTGTSFYVVQSPVLVSLISSIILKGGNRNKWTDMVEEEPEKIEYKQTTSSRSSFISFNAQLESVLLSTPSSFHQKQPLKIFESLATAFVMVKITLPQSGGAITDKCIIYAVKSLAHLNEFCPKKPSRNESQLLKGLVYTAEGGLGVGSSSSRLLDDDDDDDALVDDQLLLDKFPDKEYILGYSTRGNFVLSKGKSCAIGVVSIKRLVEFYGEQNDAVISSNHQTIWVLGRSSLGRRCWKGCLEFIGV